MYAPQHTSFHNNGNIRRGTSSSSSSRTQQFVSNEMIYNLILSTDARRSEDIARLEMNISVIRSLVIRALYPTDQDDNNSPSDVLRGNYSTVDSAENENHSSGTDETCSETSVISPPPEAPVDTVIFNECGAAFQSVGGVHDPLASSSSSARNVSGQQQEYGIGGETQADFYDGVTNNDTVQSTLSAVRANISTDQDEYEEADVIIVQCETVQTVTTEPSALAGEPIHENHSTHAESAPKTSSTLYKKRKGAARRKNGKNGGKIRRMPKSSRIVRPGTGFANSVRQTRSSGKSTASASEMNTNEMANIVVKKEPHYCTKKRVSENGETIYECYCGYKTNEKRYFNHHTKAHGLPRFWCPMCPELFPTCTEVRKHLMRDHKLRDLLPRLLKCDRCYMVFLKKEDKIGHKNERNQICGPRKPKRDLRLKRKRDRLDGAVQDGADNLQLRTPSFTIPTGRSDRNSVIFEC